ncbi:AraC family transcriptional regulator [Pedobacter sp. MC2016-14]|uniref:helix-turn-helix domain-containing protein n=1 Tax=Pedobacter sp. MC2016-14 TaxID=2897327 RepID=UPI001E62E5EF|nr:AraC family transcriptional regulator [Pedobacter sp. MC2016-14]MCD0489787.1 AraC family transcriptional regulator [Pedobacter sp. MC2016-14]
MREPFKFELLPNVLKSVEELDCLPENYKYKIDYATVKTIQYRHWTWVRQVYSARDDYYAEFVSFEVRRPVPASIRVDVPSFVFLVVFEGELSISDPLTTETFVLQTNHCMVKHFLPGNYVISASDQLTVFYYFVLSDEFLIDHVNQYPKMANTIRMLNQPNASYEYFGTYKLSTTKNTLLKKILNYKKEYKFELRAELGVLMNKVLRGFDKRIKPLAIRNADLSNSEIVSAIKAYIDDNTGAGERFTVETMAFKFNRHAKTVSRSFLMEFGFTLGDYIQHVGMKKAHNLCIDGFTFQDVSEALGYSCISAFTRAFKLHFSYTPSKAKLYSYDGLPVNALSCLKS